MQINIFIIFRKVLVIISLNNFYTPFTFYFLSKITITDLLVPLILPHIFARVHRLCWPGMCGHLWPSLVPAIHAQSLVIPGYVGSSSSPWWLSYHLQLLDKFLASPPVLCLSEPSLKPQINGEDAPPCLLATEIISSTDSAPNKLCPLQHQWWSYWFSWHWQSWGKGNGVWAAIDSWFSYPKLGSFNK